MCQFTFEFSQARGTGKAGKELQLSVGKEKIPTQLSYAQTGTPSALF